ncbi:MAG: SDR family oxidoreductase [Chloroflexi bacterium]|nr:SDR family oxidoreductase [Chloroflexota bacterium]
MQRILITGSNRGIGLELVRQYLGDGDVDLFATCRNPEQAQQLQELAHVYDGLIRVVQLEINDEDSIAAAVQAVAARVEGLDLLINNAGIGGDDHARIMGQLTASEVGRVIATNAVSPLIVTQSFRGLLKRGLNPRVVMISSGLGSLQREVGGSYAYRMSKAAMNMAARVLAFDEAMDGVTTATVNPGWVQTDMGGPNAALKPEESASALRALFKRLTPGDSGKFFQYDGSELPW